MRISLFSTLFLLGLSSLSATSLTYDLTCVLNGLKATGACAPGPSFGTVTIADTASNQVTVSVDLLNGSLKFKDLMLNFDAMGSGVTGITSTDGQVSLTPNSLSISPYAGLFDVGQLSDNAKGWDGGGIYSTILSGVNGTLIADMLNVKDSLGNVFVGLHIQSIGNSSGGSCEGNDNGTTDCVPGRFGTGSLKIGGLGMPISDNPIPEPSTYALMGSALVGIGLWRRRTTQPKA